MSYEKGIPRLYSFIFLILLWVIVILNTWLLPRYKVPVKVPKEQGENGEMWEDKLSMRRRSKALMSQSNAPSFSSLLCSLKYLLYIYWFATLHLRVQSFIGSFNPWISSVTNDNEGNSHSYY